jgi:hypothetical protein
VIHVGLCAVQPLMGLLSLPSMVISAPVIPLMRIDFFIDDTHQLPILSEGIKDIVVKFSDSDERVCRKAVEGFVELVKHGNYTLLQSN